jgi:hypothetical protein
MDDRIAPAGSVEEEMMESWRMIEAEDETSIKPVSASDVACVNVAS